MAMFVTFKDVPVGGRFLYLGKMYRKEAFSMAQDNQRIGHVFGAGGNYPVEPIHDPERREYGQLMMSLTEGCRLGLRF